MRVAGDFLASLARLVQRPAAALSVLLALALIAALFTLALLAPTLDQVRRQADPPWGPDGIDVPLVSDLSWRGAEETDYAVVWLSVATLAAMLLFALGDAVLVQAAAGPWSGIRDAWAVAARRAPTLVLTAFVCLIWIGIASYLSYRLLGKRIGDSADLLPSEWQAIGLQFVPLAAWFLLAAPVVIATDMARARLITVDRRSGTIALMWSLSRVATSPTPWMAALLAIVLDCLLIAGAAIWRPLWDPRSASSPWLSLIVILFLVGARIVIHGAYVGTLGRHARRHSCGGADGNE